MPPDNRSTERYEFGGGVFRCRMLVSPVRATGLYFWTFAPQDVQNLAPAASFAPHEVQKRGLVAGGTAAGADAGAGGTAAVGSAAGVSMAGGSMVRVAGGVTAAGAGVAVAVGSGAGTGPTRMMRRNGPVSPAPLSCVGADAATSLCTSGGSTLAGGDAGVVGRS